MCAIAGLFYPDGRPVERAQLRPMLSRLNHRGPDGEGLHTEPGMGLAHGRLAIIDIAGGHQPLANEYGTVVLVVNGEIYNFAELRERLEAAGHRFATRSDSETIVHGWEEWGPAVVDYLDGMFAFALWDRKRKTLFLARDRLGKKPLYYTFTHDAFVFASELAAFAGVPQVRRQIDPTALDDFLALGYVPDPKTIFREICKLPPGHRLLIDANGRARPQPERYWRPSITKQRGSFNDSALELRQTLGRAVADRLVADVPLGAFLSGGVDSAGVVAAGAMERARIGGPALDTFTIGFTGAEDESPSAAAIARHCGTNHVVERADDIDWIASSARQGGVFGEPFGDTSAVPMLQVCQLARRHVTVALSGDGGDEVFGGYRRHRWHMLVSAARRHIPTSLRQGPIAALGRLYPKLDRAPRFLRAKHTLTELGLDSALGYYRMVAQMQDARRRDLLHPSVRAEIGSYDPGARFAELMADSGTDDPLAQAQYADLGTWLPGRMLTKVDRTSMASGLEVRSPLLDHRLVSWGLGLPADYKLSHGRGKAVLRAAIAPWLPKEILDRPKQGFATPLAATLRAGMPQVRARLKQPDLLDAGLVNPSSVFQLLDEHESGRVDHAQPIWLLLVLAGFVRSELAAAPAENLAA